MYGIEKGIYEKLIKYFNEKSYIKNALIFGSRAKGNYKYNSDIDLGILCEENYKGIVSEDIDELIGIYSVDIVFLDSMNKEIENQIKRDGINIYKSC